jgi:diacylglycerol kinase
MSSPPSSRVRLACFFRINTTEWIQVVLCCGFVFATECMNTAVELLADRITIEEDIAIKYAKDAAAAAVLLSAIAAALIGAIIFIPKIWDWLIVKMP